MSRFMRGYSWLICAFIVCALPGLAQQNLPDGPTPKNNQSQSQQGVPDAPQPKNPNGFPNNAPPAPINNHEEGAPTPTPSPAAAENRAPNDLPSKREDLYQMHINVNFVQVPVTVKDSSGKLVPGLTSNDFKVYEDGQLQQLKYFTADAFPLSAAIVVATDLPSSTMKKVNESLPALIGAFSQYDEVALYRYGHTVSQVSAYTGAASLPTSVLNRVKRSGREGGPPIVGGPFGGGPTINGHSVNDPNAGGQGDVQTPPRESYVLNDAILLAAQGLSRRDKTRRRIIFVISDGREQGSNANYNEVKKILLSNNISVFAIGVDTAAIPIYDKLNRIRVPGFGTGNILARYANDTGGNVLAEFDRQGIEQAYSQITETARNQYTLGYTTRATQAGNYRTIDVRVLRPNLNVIAKPGYYPLPPQPQNR
ncbi:MAG TPA: VWA domain-containing protein [Candidatus Angelobacter sp.]|nr:VWA domain-containing protein [Candidatus Angelobacter sp.]